MSWRRECCSQPPSRWAIIALRSASSPSSPATPSASAASRRTPSQSHSCQLGPLGAVAVGAYARGPLGCPREQWDGLPPTACTQNVVSDPFRRRAIGGEQSGGIRVHAPHRLLGQQGGQLFSHECVPEAI